MSTPNERVLSDLLSERNAVAFNGAELANLPDGQLIRYWPELRPDLFLDALEFLQEYSSVKNFPKASKVVVEPRADKKEREGTWRCTEVAIRKEGELVQVFQTLKEGWHTTSLPWTSARIVSNDKGIGATELKVRWVGVNPAQLNTLVATMDAATVVNPVVKGETYTGTYHRIHTAAYLDDDGVGVVELELSLTKKLKAYASERSFMDDEDRGLYGRSLYGVTAPESGRRGIYRARNSFNPDGTYTSDLIYNASTEVTGEFVFEDGPFVKGLRDFYRRMDSVVSTPDQVAGGGLYSATWDIRPDGTYDGNIDYRVANNSGQAEFASRRAALQDEDSGIYRARTARIVAPVPGARGIYNATNDLGADGLYDSRLVYERSKSSEVYFVSARSPLRTEQRRMYHAVDDGVTVPTPTIGTYRVTEGFRADGTYDADVTYATSVENDLYIRARDSARADHHSWDFQNRRAGIPDPGAPAHRGIYRVRGRVNDDGTYNGDLVYESSDEGVLTWTSRRTAFNDEVTSLYEAHDGSVGVPATVNSGVYRTSNRFRADGTYDAELIYSRPGTGGEAVFSSQRGVFESDDSGIYRGRTTPVNAPSSGVRGLYRTSNQMTEEGTYTSNLVYEASTLTELETIKARDFGGEAIEKMYLRHDGKVVPPAVAGRRGLYQLGHTARNDGTYDVSVLYRKSTALGWDVASHSKLSEMYVTAGRNQDVIPANNNPDQGTIYSIQGQQGDDGTYAYSVQARTSKEYGAVMAFQAKYGTGYVYAEKAQRTLAAPTMNAYANNSASFGINEDGTYDITASTTPSAASGSTESDDWDDGLYSVGVYERKWRNHAGQMYYADVYIEFSVKQTQNMKKAYLHLDEGKDGSEIQNLGINNYRAIKVTSIGTYTWVHVPIS